MFIEDNMSFMEECHAIHRDALVIVSCPQDARISCGEVSDVSFPKLYSIVTALYFTLACKNLSYLHFAVGAFGNDHMWHLSSQKNVVLNSE